MRQNWSAARNLWYRLCKHSPDVCIKDVCCQLVQSELFVRICRKGAAIGMNDTASSCELWDLSEFLRYVTWMEEWERQDALNCLKERQTQQYEWSEQERSVLSEQDNNVGKVAWKRTVATYDSSLNPGLLGFTGSESTGFFLIINCCSGKSSHLSFIRGGAKGVLVCDSRPFSFEADRSNFASLYTNNDNLLMRLLFFCNDETVSERKEMMIIFVTAKCACFHSMINNIVHVTCW